MRKNSAVLVSCFSWYEARLKHVASALRNRGYDVAILTSDFDHEQKQSIQNTIDACSYIHVPPYSKNISAKRVLSHSSFARSVRRMLSSYSPELIYVLIPPNSVISQCSKYKATHPGTKLIADVIDLWPESFVSNLLPLPLASYWRGMRTQGLARADYVFTECEYYQKEIAKELPDGMVSTLHLCRCVSAVERDLARSIREGRESLRTPENDTLKLGFVGSMNHILDIDGVASLVDALKRRWTHVEIHAIGDGEKRDSFLVALCQAGAEVSYYGRVYDQLQKIRLLGPCDFGVNMMRESVDVGLTIKSVDYLSMGLPIINSISGDTAELVAKESIGVNVRRGDSGQINNDLKDFSVIPTYDHVTACFDAHFSENAFRQVLASALESIIPAEPGVSTERETHRKPCDRRMGKI